MKGGGLLRIYCVLGFIFLYAPILSLIIFSFNESKLVTVWGGFSTKWYGELFRDPQILGSAWISFQVAFVTATIAVSTAMNTRVRLRVGLTDILDCFLSADCYSGDSQVDADLLRRPDELIGDT